MKVVDARGDPAGSVKALRARGFLLQRTLAPDVYLDYRSVQSVAANVVKLMLTSEQIDDASWQEGPPAPSPT